MTGASVIALGVAVSLLALVVVWLVQRNTELVNQLLAARASDADNALKAERAGFDDAQDRKALDGERKKEQAVVDALAHDTTVCTGAAALPPDDVDGRVRAAEAAQGAAAAAEGARAGAAASVRGDAPAAPSGADLLRPGE